MDTVNMTADETFLVVIISALIFAFVSIGIACFVTYLILNKYNNFGDTSCSLYQYSTNGISYKLSAVIMSFLKKRTNYMLVKGDNPYENIERSIPEQLLKTLKIRLRNSLRSSERIEKSRKF